MDFSRRRGLFHAASTCQTENEASEVVRIYSKYIHAVDKAGLTPFLATILYNESPRALIEALLSFDPSVIAAIDGQGRNTMHLIALKESGVSLCRYLHALSPDLVRSFDKEGNTALHLCSYDKEVAQYLVEVFPEATTVQNSRGSFPVHLAAERANLDVFKVFAAASPSTIMYTADEVGTPIIHAILTENIEIIKFICEEYSDTASLLLDFRSWPSMTALHWASLLAVTLPSIRRLDIVKIIYATRPSAISTFVETYGWLPLHCIFYPSMLPAIARPDCGVIRHFPAVETDGETQCRLLRFLISEYPDGLLAPDKQGRLTPYDLCCMLQPEYVKRIALRMKPDVDMSEYRRLNWQHRRMAVFMAFSAKYEAGALGNCLLRLLADRCADVYREVVSFL